MATRKKRMVPKTDTCSSQIDTIDCIQIDDEDDTPTPMAIARTGELHTCEDVGMDVSFPSAEWFDINWGPEDVDVTPPKDANVDSSVSNGQATINNKKRKRKRNAMKLPEKSSVVGELRPIRKKKVPIKQEFLEKNETFELVNTEVASTDLSDGEDLATALPTNKTKAKTNQKIDEASDAQSVACASREYFDDEDPIFLFQTNKSLSKQNEIKMEIEKNVSKEQNSFSKDNNPATKYGIESNADSHIMKEICTYKNKFSKEFNNFNKAIWTHMTTNLQNDHTYTWKMRVRTMLHNQIRMLIPTCSLLAVGSTVNGCGSYNSDMDLCLGIPCPAEGFETPRSYAIKYLRKVKKHLLQTMEIIRQIEYIPAKVPILKIYFENPYNNLEIDMNVNNIAGIYNSFLLHNYSRIDDRFPALCLILKHWAKIKGIGDASSGFLNSYSIILMVLHFLQCGVNPPVLPSLQRLYPHEFRYNRPFNELRLFNDLPNPLPSIPLNEQSVGELLMAFFDYYNRFNFNRHAISITRGCIFPRTDLPSNTDRFKLFIEEPFDQQNTARCVTHDEQWMIILDEIGRAALEFSSSSTHPPNLRRIGIRTGFPC